MTRFIKDVLSNPEAILWTGLLVAVLVFGGVYLWAKIVTRLRKK